MMNTMINKKVNDKEMTMVNGGVVDPIDIAATIRRLKKKKEEKEIAAQKAAEEEWNALHKSGGACGGW